MKQNIQTNVFSVGYYRLDHFCERLIPKPRIKGRGCCIRLPREIVNDPDPSIYSQHLEFAAG